MSVKITAKSYFRAAVGLPLAAIIVTTAIVWSSSDAEWLLTKEGLDYFVRLYQIPLTLVGVLFAFIGAAFAYYRSELAYEQSKQRIAQVKLGIEQNERQIAQHQAANYNSFRSEFLGLLEERDYRYSRITIPDRWLFSHLYPNAKNGLNDLNSEFEEFILDDTQGFKHAMNVLNGALSASDGSQYRAGTYLPVSNLFLWLRGFIPVDADINLSFIGGAKFNGNYAETTHSVAADILHIVATVNAIEGWRFFENSELRNWRKAIDRLPEIINSCDLIDVFYATTEWQKALSALIGNDLDGFREENIYEQLPEDIRNNKSVAKFIFTEMTTGNFENLLSVEAQGALTEALRLPKA